MPSDESVEEGKAPLEEVAQPTNEAEAAGEAEAGLRPESLGETIFLELTDEVQLEAGEPLHKSEKTAEVGIPGRGPRLKRIKKQKAALAKALAGKKQKAALAKTRAQKKQKMIMAKDAALKRKKAAQAKVLQLKKQSAAAENH